MTDDLAMTLADDFPSATPQRWRVLVDAVLAKGMRDPSPEDLARRFERDPGLAHLRRRHDPAALHRSAGRGRRTLPGFPGLAPFVRGRTPLATAIGGWDVCQRVEVSGDGGAAGPLARRRSWRVAPARCGSDWRTCPRLDVDVLDRALAGVYLELIPVRLDAGRRGLEASEALFELWHRRGVEPDTARASLGLDPLGDGLVGVDGIS